MRQPAYPDFTYRNNDAARRAIERDGKVTLGDMGYVDDDGYLFVCDRASDMVISGGVNIYPAEIEHEVVRYPGVADCVVFGAADRPVIARAPWMRRTRGRSAVPRASTRRQAHGQAHGIGGRIVMAFTAATR